MPSQEWIDKVKEALESLKNLKAKDRLESVAAISRCVASIESSTTGWASWLSTPAVMKAFSKKELDKILESFKEFAIFYLTLDLKWTIMLERKTAQLRKKDERERKKKARKSKKKKTHYIS